MDKILKSLRKDTYNRKISTKLSTYQLIDAVRMEAEHEIGEQDDVSFLEMNN